MLRRIALIFALVTALFFTSTSFAQQPKGCDGPADLCAQVQELQKDLQTQKAIAADHQNDKNAAVQQKEEEQQSKAAKMMALSAAIAVILKVLISMAKAWTGFFKTDKGVASIKVGSLILGFAAFVLTNIGMGIPWWQALIVAGGPPGAILVHELMDLVPVIQGKKKLSDVPTDSNNPSV